MRGTARFGVRVSRVAFFAAEHGAGRLPAAGKERKRSRCVFNGSLYRAKAHMAYVRLKKELTRFDRERAKRFARFAAVRKKWAARC